MMPKAGEGLLENSVVYITKQGAQVGVDGGRIVVYAKEYRRF